jgi:hypothetical protein
MIYLYTTHIASRPLGPGRRLYGQWPVLATRSDGAHLLVPPFGEPNKRGGHQRLLLRTLTSRGIQPACPQRNRLLSMAVLGVLLPVLDGSHGPRARPTPQLTCDGDENVNLCGFRQGDAQIGGSLHVSCLLAPTMSMVPFWMFPTQSCFSCSLCSFLLAFGLCRAD